MDIGIVTHIKGDDLTILASHEPGNNHFPSGRQVKLQDTACNQVIVNDGLICLEAEGSNHKFFENLPAGCSCYTGLPIRIDGQIIGTLCFLNFQTVPHGHDVNRQEFELLALVVAGQLERRFHLNTEHELRQIASIVQTSEDAIFTETLDRIILTWNAAAEKTVRVHCRRGNRQAR